MALLCSFIVMSDKLEILNEERSSVVKQLKIERQTSRSTNRAVCGYRKLEILNKEGYDFQV